MPEPLDLGGLADVFPVVYPELRRAARALLHRERIDHTLQPTALVNEALLRLSQGRAIPTDDPQRFVFMVVREMRRELTDHARRARTLKRSWHLRSEAPEDLMATEMDPTTVVAIDAALDKLQLLNPRAVALIEMRFFGGLTGEEIAAVLNIAPRTVERIWQAARKWLYLEMAEQAVVSDSH